MENDNSGYTSSSVGIQVGS